MGHEPVIIIIIIIIVKTVIACSFAVMKAVGNVCVCVCGNGCNAPAGCSNVISFSGDWGPKFFSQCVVQFAVCRELFGGTQSDLSLFLLANDLILSLCPCKILTWDWFGPSMTSYTRLIMRGIWNLHGRGNLNETEWKITNNNREMSLEEEQKTLI